MTVRKKPIKSDLKRLDAMKDEDIDYSEIPEADESFWEHAVVEIPEPKKGVYIRLDADVSGMDESAGQGLPKPD